MLPVVPMVLLQTLHLARLQAQLVEICRAVRKAVPTVPLSAAIPPEDYRLLGTEAAAARLSGYSETALLEIHLDVFCSPSSVGGTFNSSNIDHGSREERIDVWSNPQIRGNIAKTVCALELHLLKNAANSTNELFGARSKILCMTFVLRRFPSKRKALQIAIAGGATHSTEGLFLKTSTGKRTLSVQFGSGDSENATLVANVHTILEAVRRKVDVKSVMEIYLGVDRLMLPIWSFKLWDRGKRRSERALVSNARKTSMSPPDALPRKRLKTG